MELRVGIGGKCRPNVRNPKIHPEHIPRKRENIHELAADYTLRSLCVLCVSAVYIFFRFFLPPRRKGRRDYAEEIQLLTDTVSIASS